MTAVQVTEHCIKMPHSFLKWRPHPWHGLAPGPNPPERVSVFVEITPFDHVKYEIDKYSGFLKVDRPQYSSSLPPTVYGFIPQTLCADKVGALMDGATEGDDDPLDVCVVSSHAINHSEILLTARVVGGIPMLDNGCADDKIIAVLDNDGTYGNAATLSDIPGAIVDQLVHYFSTYKGVHSNGSVVRVGTPYGYKHACKVVEASIADYNDKFSK